MVNVELLHCTFEPELSKSLVFLSIQAETVSISHAEGLSGAQLSYSSLFRLPRDLFSQFGIAHKDTLQKEGTKWIAKDEGVDKHAALTNELKSI